MIEKYEKLYDESIKLIDENPNLTTKAIPNHLLDVWLYNGVAVEIPPSFEFLFAVSIYKYANDKYGDSAADVDSGRYARFQNILATEYACRKVGAKLRPFQIFNFERYSDSLNVDMKRNQVSKYQNLAAKLIPLQQ